jgi:hypothetical protein
MWSLHFQWSLTARDVVQRPSLSLIPEGTGLGPHPPIQALRKSFRNHPDHRSDNPLKLTDLKSESVISFIPES